MSRRFGTLLFGIVLGTTLGLLLCPDPAARLRALASRLRAVPSVSAGYDEAVRRLDSVVVTLRGRYEIALDESRRAAEETRRALWAQFEAAKKKQEPPQA